MTVKVLFLAITLCLLGTAYAQTCQTSHHYDATLVPTSSTLQLTIPDKIASMVQLSYYASTSNQVEISWDACSQTANDATLNFKPTLTNEGGNAHMNILAVDASGGTGTPVDPTTSTTTGLRVTSPSSRLGVDKHVSLFAAVLVCLFALPKNRISITILLAILAVGFFTPSSAQGSATITIKVGVPASITQICENSKCEPYGAPTAAPTAAPVVASMNLRVLIISPASSSTLGLDLAKLAFDSHGMPYDVLAVGSVASALSTTGTGKYSGIVSIGRITDATAASAIATYQTTFGVNYAVLASSPTSPSALPDLTVATSSTSSAFTISLGSGSAVYTKAIQPSVSIKNNYVINWSDKSLKTTTVNIAAGSTQMVPALMCTIGSSAAAPCAVIYTDASGNDQLHYFVDNVPDLFASMVFMPLLVNFVAPAGVFIGRRRISLTVQADDFFLPTFKWNTVTKAAGSGNDPTYRMDATDLQNLHNFYTTINTNGQLPSGSYLTVEWPFNGGGIGSNYADPLFVLAKQLQKDFWWITHTWDHPCDFDTIAADKAQEMTDQLVNNINWTPTFLDGGLDSPYFSKTSMINPCITGLKNGPVLEAMAHQGIVHIVGDNSKPEYLPPFPYHAWITNVSFNGYAGIFVVPRVALDIYFDTPTPDLLIAEYQTMYKEASPKTLEDIMLINQKYGVQNMVSFRQDPFMMHQCNGASFSYGGETTSFIALWTKRVALETASYYTLPIYANKMEDIWQIWKQRTDMDNCGISVTLGITADKKLSTVSASSTGTCEVTLSGLDLTGHTGIEKVETYGPEITTFVALTPSTPQTFTLTTPVAI